MDKSDGNIDIVFRDGLKNLEVLPPSEVWENVRTDISSARPSAFYFRVAAGIAAIVSLGLLAFFVGMRTSESALDRMVAEQTLLPSDMLRFTEQQNDLAVVAEVVESKLSTPTVSASSEISPVESITDGDREPLLLKASPALTSNNTNSRASLNILDGGLNAENQESTIENPEVFLTGVEMDSNSDIQEGRWMVGARISPTYLSTNLKADNKILSDQQGEESALLSYTGGLSVVYSVGNRLSLQTGIYYSSLGRQVSDIRSYSGYAGYAESKGGKIFGVATTSGTIASTNRDIYLVDQTGNRISSTTSVNNFDPDKAGLNPFGSSLRQNFEYIEVPFMLSYKLIDKKVDFNIMGGMSYSLLLDNEVYAVSDGSVIPIGSMEDLAGILLSSSFGMSMNYSLSDNFSLNLEPSIRYFLNSDGTLSASNNPFTFGIFSGVYYKF